VTPVAAHMSAIAKNPDGRVVQEAGYRILRSKYFNYEHGDRLIAIRELAGAPDPSI